MNLTKENVKKICGIILFTVVVLVIVQNYEKVGNAIGLLWGIISVCFGRNNSFYT